MKRWLFLLILIIPVAGLATLVYNYQRIVSSGLTVTFPVRGYDPRDLLSGHYLVYRVDYGAPALECGKEQPACFCIQDAAPTPPRGKFTNCDKNESCKAFIRGTCKHGAFRAGIDRFYLNEKKAVEARVTPGDRVVVAVGENGTAIVKDFLQGKPP